MINIETLSDLELDLLQAEYEKFNAGRPVQAEQVDAAEAQK